jgi:ubiquinone biosynthesis protein COQ4
MRYRDEMFPPPLPVRPDKALAAFFGLMRNKEDTSHVFAFSSAINGKTMGRMFRAWIDSENGELLFHRDPEALLRALDDRDRLRGLPVGTVGRTYAEFMDREGLRTNGVSEAYHEDGAITEEFKAAYPEFAAYIWFLNLAHDMYHVLTGYNRDSLGEAALLNYTTRITLNRGIRYLAALASLRIKAEAPDVPVFQIMTNARKMGERSENLVLADFIGMLDRPLREVREELNIVPDPVYAKLPQERLLGLVQPQAA